MLSLLILLVDSSPATNTFLAVGGPWSAMYLSQHECPVGLTQEASTTNGQAPNLDHCRHFLYIVHLDLSIGTLFTEATMLKHHVATCREQKKIGLHEQAAVFHMFRKQYADV